ncbi:hypothetical protein [Streptomyces sp. NRRL F-5135]|uniref:hypothetical protein n=1 Tax=Streptomyces sp. NRRL F-5135 TaxID=1463858 RepID=UPI0004C61718|nr:hypothetical protein [Streptomyces sp. NRRL F-5135]
MTQTRHQWAIQTVARAVLGTVPGASAATTQVTVTHRRDWLTLPAHDTWSGSAEGLGERIVTTLFGPDGHVPAGAGELARAGDVLAAAHLGWPDSGAEDLYIHLATALDSAQLLQSPESAARTRRDTRVELLHELAGVFGRQGMHVAADLLYRKASAEAGTGTGTGEKDTPAQPAGAAFTPSTDAAPEQQTELVRLRARLAELEEQGPLGDLREELGFALVDAGRVPGTMPVVVHGQVGVLADAVLPVVRRALAAARTEYLASHEFFPVGRYTNAEAAREHIEYLLVQEEGPEARERIVWSEAETPDDGVAVWDVALRDVVSGDLVPTMYMVTALPLASAHNPEADS